MSREGAYEGARPEVQALVPRSARRVLDLGCAAGSLGAALRERQGAEVVGVELDPAYAARASERLDRVLCADVEELAARADLEADLGRFDCVVAADVLEHLREPWLALRRLSALLEPGGAVVLSLPNVRFWETLWQVGIRGRWPLREEGIFDRTHLRWFTVHDAEHLVGQAGLAIEEVTPVHRFRPLGSRFDRYARHLERTPLGELVTFQVLLRARRP